VAWIRAAADTRTGGERMPNRGMTERRIAEGALALVDDD
jgi:hypothetical protein